ncbi:AI-2E family transporter [Phenylobacterium sp.]|uniref:AI-2E family transporter n=1 Tax=Phenylobacterium sp. TaxID=1871053 RepID=UPI002F417FF8
MSDVQAIPAAGGLRLYALKVLIALGLGAAAFILFRWLHVLVLAFGAAVVSILLRALADPIRRRTPLDAAWSVAAAVLVMVGLVGGAIYFVGEQVSIQFTQLERDLPGAWAAAERQLANFSGGRWALDHLHQASQISVAGLGPLAGQIGRITGAGVGAAAQFVVVLVAGVYFAAQPQLYRNGLLGLLPAPVRRPVATIVDESGVALRKWLLGAGLAMIAMGVLTGIGAALLGLPAPLALGLISGLAEFVPIVGAAVSAVPGLLLAAAHGPQMAFSTLIFYVAVHQVEGHVLIPLIQRRIVAVPPALTIFAVLGFGVLLGPLGIILATPLAVVLMAVARRLYIDPEPAAESDRPRTGPVGARGRV